MCALKALTLTLSPYCFDMLKIFVTQQFCLTLVKEIKETYRLIDMSSLAKGLTQYCTALRVLHASAFNGKGKIRPIKPVKGKSSFIETFAKLGSSWKVPEHTLVELEEFTCLVNKNKYTLKLSMTSDITCLKKSVVTKRSTQVSTWICQLYHLVEEV